MRVLKDFVKWFLYITMGILIVCAVNFQIADAESIPKETLWQILLSGFLTTGITVLLYPRNGSNKSTFWVEILAHYLALCIIMILCGYWFGWLDFDLGGIVMMVVSVAAVYGITFLIYYLIDLKQADEINQKLKEKYGERE
ncbi:MAG: DUF3021 domain-containing protein [Lachnospiraceae bacterium]|nr:DUF3021 domain-containing protein [Lachnospiraceae bacterium]